MSEMPKMLTEDDQRVWHMAVDHDDHCDPIPFLEEISELRIELAKMKKHCPFGQPVGEWRGKSVVDSYRKCDFPYPIEEMRSIITRARDFLDGGGSPCDAEESTGRARAVLGELEDD